MLHPFRRDTLLRPRRSQVEGTVLSMLALVGIAYTKHAVSIGILVIACTFTVGVYWLANVYADVLASNDVDHGRLRDRVRTSCAHEAHVFGPAIGLVGTVTLLRLLGMGITPALLIVLTIGCIVLFTWGMLAARRSQASVIASLVAGTCGALIGLLVIIGKLVLHH